MKRMIIIIPIIVVLIVIAVILCAPLIENHEEEVKYYSGGYANTKGILQGLCTGNISECYDVIYSDPNDYTKIHPEYVDPALPEKLEQYAQLIDGRHYKHTAAVDYTLEGDYPNPPYVETCFMEVILEDGTNMYAIVVFRQEEDGCGVTDFDLYTECPW